MNKEQLKVLSNLKILLVDDEEKVRLSLLNILKEFCKDVLEAKDGLEAWDKYMLHQPDIIFVDIQMPKENGLEFIKKVRKNDFKTNIVILSAFNEIEFLKEAIPLKLEDYIIKPITFKALMEVLENGVKNNSIKIDIKVYFPSGAVYDSKQQIVYYNDSKFIFGYLEDRLFKLLLEKKNSVVSTKEIETYVWDKGNFTENALKSILQKIRKKLGKESIETYRGIGYKLIVLDKNIY